MIKITAAVFFFTKRQLKQISFWVILLLFPIFTLFFKPINNTEKTHISVAVYTPADSQNTSVSGIVQNLSAQNGIFTFYSCESEAALYKEVAAAKAECGYIFPSDLFDQLDNHKKNNLVDVVVSPSTTMNKVINEVVYSVVFEEYSLHLLKGYLKQEGLLNDVFPQTDPADSLEHEVETIYQTHRTDNSTFSFSYQTETASIDRGKTDMNVFLLTPVRGLIAIFIFLSGFCGTVNYYKDNKAHLFDNRTLSSKRGLQLLSISIPVLLSAAAGLLCLICAGLSRGFLHETAALLTYSLLVILFCMVLSLLIPNILLFYSAIPVFMIGSLIFTPVFIDVTMFLPMLKPVSYLFIPYYYYLIVL